MAGTAPRHTGHAVTVRFYPVLDPTPREIVCACGWQAAYPPDRSFPDPDQPLLDGYAQHRAQQQAGYGRIHGQGWQSRSIG